MSAGRFKSSEDSPRLLVPKAVIAALDALAADEPVPSHVRVELRRLADAVERLYKIKGRFSPMSEVDIAHALQEEDGIPLEDAP